MQVQHCRTGGQVSPSYPAGFANRMQNSGLLRRCILQGERDYAAIEGSTGPIVYPAGHLYSYTLLYWLTGHGQVALAQPIFVVLYLATQVDHSEQVKICVLMIPGVQANST